MKRIFPLAVCVVALLALSLSLVEYFALGDIWKDYVSPRVVARYSPLSLDDFPDWTRTRLEWTLVVWGLYGRMAASCLLAAAAAAMWWRERPSAAAQGA